MRRKTLSVKIGKVFIGSDHSIKTQSMTTASTMDTDKSVDEAIRIIQAGGKLVRFTAPNINEAKNLLNIKNALVASNEDEAATAGGMLESNFKEFDKSPYSSEEQKELTDIITDAIEHAEHISESPLEHQREHFDLLSKDLIDMIAITGTDKKLYQDYCPMYNNNKGAAWLSTTKEIKNPYFGSKMMNCGKIQKEIN